MRRFLYLYRIFFYLLINKKHQLDITTWSIVSILFKRSMNSLLSAFSGKSWPLSKSVGTLTWPISSRQLKIYFLASLDLIPVSASCSSGVFNRQNGYVPESTNKVREARKAYSPFDITILHIKLRTVHVPIKEFGRFTSVVQHVLRR